MCGANLRPATAQSSPTTDWLVEQYQQGNLDTLRAWGERFPDSEPMGAFIRGIFETDGEAARFHFDRVVALSVGNKVEGLALERLWQYHFAKGELQQAERYWFFLTTRHPDMVKDITPPNFAGGDGLSELTNFDDAAPLPSINDKWTIQVGAFADIDRARNVGRQVEPYGNVLLVTRPHNKGTLTAVQVGRFADRGEAERLQEIIQSATGLKCRVVAIDKI